MSETRNKNEGGWWGFVRIAALALSPLIVSLALASPGQPQPAVAASGHELLHLTRDAEAGVAAKVEAIARANSNPAEVVKDLDLRRGDHEIRVRVVPLAGGFYRLTSTATDAHGRSIQVVLKITKSVRPVATLLGGLRPPRKSAKAPAHAQQRPLRRRA